MPIYLPWLTVLTAIFTIIGVFLAGNKSTIFISLYVAPLIIYFCLGYLNIAKCPKSVILLSLVPLIILCYTNYRQSNPGQISLSTYNNKSTLDTKSSSEPKALNIIEQTRQIIARAHINNLGQKAGSLLSSMVLGDRAAPLDKQLLNTFRKLGLSHIVAASGFNLTIITLLTYWLLRKLSLPGTIVTFIVGANVIFYASLAGLSASIVRAAITCLLVLITHHYYRQLHGLASLSFVLIVNAIIDPKVITQTGAQLSYAAVAGIIFGASVLANTLSFGSQNKIIKNCSAAISVILMAQLSVLPIQLYHFRQTSILFLPANLIIDPLVTPITIIGFIASLTSLINLPHFHIGLLICQCLDWLAAIPLQMIIYIAEKLDCCSLSTVNTGQPFLISIIFYYLALIGFILLANQNKLALLRLALLLCGFIALFYQPALSQGLLIFLPNAAIAINNHRQAICFGIHDNKVDKIMSYYAASTNQLQKTVSSQDMPNPPFELCSKPNTITLSENSDHSYLLTNQLKLDCSSKQYIISRRQINFTALNKTRAVYVCPISLSQLKKELPNLQIKAYSAKTISVYSLIQ